MRPQSAAQAIALLLVLLSLVLLPLLLLVLLVEMLLPPLLPPPEDPPLLDLLERLLLGPPEVLLLELEFGSPEGQLLGPLDDPLRGSLDGPPLKLLEARLPGILMTEDEEFTARHVHVVAPTALSHICPGGQVPMQLGHG